MLVTWKGMFLHHPRFRSHSTQKDSYRFFVNLSLHLSFICYFLSGYDEEKWTDNSRKFLDLDEDMLMSILRKLL